MSDIPALTSEDVIRPWHRHRRGKVWEITVKCPHCGGQHSHGGGVGEIPDAGHRAGDCAFNNGYYLPDLWGNTTGPWQEVNT